MGSRSAGLLRRYSGILSAIPPFDPPGREHAVYRLSPRRLFHPHVLSSWPSHCGACKFARVKDFLRGAELPVFLLDPQILQAFCLYGQEDSTSLKNGRKEVKTCEILQDH